jgi:phosphatidylglycerol---prolipoprotein diacylglyceryl transferase
MIEFIQSLPSRIDPVLLRLGPFSLHWYSLMYVTALAVGYLTARARLRRGSAPGWTEEDLETLLSWLVFGIVLGARLGYVLFYDPGYYLSRPWEIVLPFHWEGRFVFTGIRGLSYHGGLVGAGAACFFFAHRRKLNPWVVSDLLSGAAPLGYTFGRLGNFFNGELWGRPTSAPWGMYFPEDPSGLLRHPSQLYEAAFEGLFLFWVLGLIVRRRPRPGTVMAAYVAGYGLVRFVLEFFRAPDAQLGLVVGPLTLGQLLCLAMVGAGAGLYVHRREKA